MFANSHMSYVAFLSFAAEIAMLENNIIVYKFVQDLHFFVTGGDDENELILATVLQGFFDAVTLLLRYWWSYLQSLFLNYNSDDLSVSAFMPSNLACPCYRNNVEKREALENLDLILLCLDEIVDGGYVICFSYTNTISLCESSFLVFNSIFCY